MMDVNRTLRRIQCAGRRSTGLYRLRREPCNLAGPVACAVRKAWTHELTPEEQRWIDRIERQREQLNASMTPITRTDYGAGEPGSNRTAEQMQAGVNIDDTVGQISKRASKAPFWCRVLFQLIRAARPASCIEMGTAVGISAAYQAVALRLNNQGELVTLEGAAAVADVAKTNLEELGLDTVDIAIGAFHDTLAGVLDKRRPVDYVFVDGHHDEHATRAYFEQILPCLAERALLVFDDIAWSGGMKNAWQAIAHDERINVAVDLGPVGVCIVDRTVAGQKYFRVPLS